MRIFYTIILLLSVSFASAQTLSDSATQARAYFEEFDSACRTPQAMLWGRSLYGPVLLVNPQTKQIFTNTQDKEGKLEAVGKVWTGMLEPSVQLGNTSMDWGGVHWAMIILPLPDKASKRLTLLIHENFHRVQGDLGFKMASPMCPELDTKEGRIWFRLELEALRQALDKPVDQRKHDMESALLFREKRYSLFPDARAKEEALEWNEGLAEFTGTYGSRIWQTDSGYLQHLVINDTAFPPNYTRGFAYLSGPIYGVLLSQKDPTWNKRTDSTGSFIASVEQVYGVGVGDTASVASRVGAYQADLIVQQETLREEKRQALASAYKKSLVDGPVLRLDLHMGQGLSVSFNPSILVPLQGYGTVYPYISITDQWGTLLAQEGALMSDDWKQLWLSAPNGSVTMGAESGVSTVSGPGWKMTLHSGWTVKAGTRHGDWDLVKQ
jgi:hypothetical protein